MSFKRSFIGIIFCLGIFSTYGQTVPVDSVYNLGEVEISDSRLSGFSTGTKVQEIDTTLMTINRRGNLADLLSEASPLFIKSYGLGSLATTSFRGGSAYHTAVLWNGFNLNSYANGQMDLALIPGILSDKVNIQYGGSTALWGSGAVGGAILLDKNLDFNKGLKIELGSGIGSFGTFSKNIDFEVSKEKWIYSVKLFHIDADNNFTFKDHTKTGTPSREQVHAELEEFALISESAYRITDNQKLDLRFWYQKADRNIPPILLQTYSSSNQKDESYRITSEWQLNKNYVLYQLRAAYFDELLDYKDPNIIESGKSSAKNLIVEGEIKLPLGKSTQINVGINNTYATARADHYSENLNQNRSAIFASVSNKSRNGALKSSLSFRQELIDERLAPFAFSLGAEYMPKQWISVKASVSRVYRLPTFNELFWIPGGNPDLLAESGFTEDFGLVINPVTRANNIKTGFEFSAFNRNIDNWIVWKPTGAYWSPQNLLKVWSRGFEATASFKIRMKELHVYSKILSSYTVSTNEVVKIPGDASLGKQLIYVPLYNGNGLITIDYKSLQLIYSQIYTGYRYTSSDNEAFLPDFWIANLAAGYNIIAGKYSLNFTAKLNNLFNSSYQVLLNRPMPLSNYQLGLQIAYHHSYSKPKP